MILGHKVALSVLTRVLMRGRQEVGAGGDVMREAGQRETARCCAVGFANR